MAKLHDFGAKARSKNAGPFWVTIDVFCDSATAFEALCPRIQNTVVADLFKVDPSSLKRFEIASLNVIKISVPRPTVQGSRFDRDMHGAQAAVLLNELDLPA